jgi:prevent-host-death family protein
MQVVNIHDAKTQFSKLVEAVSRGEGIIIAKAGKPVARLGPIVPVVRQPGSMKGKIRIADDFDAPLPAEVLAGFEGN